MKAAAPATQRRTPPEPPVCRPHCSCAQAGTCANRVQKRSAQDDPALPPGGATPAGDSADDDRFHLNCVVAQVWLVQLRRYLETRYLDSSSPTRPALQTGYAWRSFSTLFEPPNALEAVRLFENLLRFANYESAAPARAFFLAYAPLAFEHDACGQFIGPGVWSPEAGLKNATARVRRTLQRWCDWLEALMHWQIRQLHSAGAVPGDLDRTLIFLWPLATRHKWNAPDLLTVLQDLLNNARAFPYESPAQLVGYCRATLGLRLPNRPTALAQGELPGHEVAQRLFRFLPAIG